MRDISLVEEKKECFIIKTKKKKGKREPSKTSRSVFITRNEANECFPICNIVYI